MKDHLKLSLVKEDHGIVTKVDVNITKDVLGYKFIILAEEAIRRLKMDLLRECEENKIDVTNKEG